LLTLDGTPSSPVLPLLSTGLIAVLFQPLRERLQRAVNHFMYGERDEPYVVLSRLGQRLETALEAEAMLPTIVETIAHTFKIPYVAMTLKQDEEFTTIVTYGESRDDLLCFPLKHRTEIVGELLVAPRSPGEPFTAADRHLLNDLVRQAGAAAHSVKLAKDLQHSRERLVMAREEERRRLRRDLHDSLGPALASQMLKLDAARNLLAHNPAGTANLLLELKSQTQRSIADIRRLVYELRPPTLDELGLTSALREQAALYSQSGLTITLDLPSVLPPLSAALEVAVYRIAQEALTNVVRHAQARMCMLRLCCIDSVRLEICDDGCGLPDMRHVSVGLTSMRERAEELGGTCEIISEARRGTRVLVNMPLPKEF